MRAAGGVGECSFGNRPVMEILVYSGLKERATAGMDIAPRDALGKPLDMLVRKITRTAGGAFQPRLALASRLTWRRYVGWALKVRYH